MSVTSLSLYDCVQQLTTEGILAADQIQAVLDALPDSPQESTAEALLRALVKQDLLTAYQARVVLEGRAKSLNLGNYLVLDELGKGGMGEVFKAQHRVMDRIVALKVISQDVVKSPDSLQRFHREVRAAAKLTHANVVAAYDAAEVAGVHFLVMEYVDGQDLSSLVKQGGPLPVGQAVSCILQAARGLEYAHQRSIIHRDIKPSNLLLDREGVVKILDMGLARIATEVAPGRLAVQDADLTNSGVILGTIDYMAPEQAKNTKHADRRADIYSLGISLFYLLTGRPAYGGDSLISKLLAHQTQPIPSLQEAVPSASAELDAVFHKMVAKEADDRYQTMSEVIAAFEALATPAGPAAKAPAAVSEDAQLSDFLRLMNVQGAGKPKQPTSSKSGKHGAAAKGPATKTAAAKPAAHPAAPVPPTAVESDQTIAADSDTQRTVAAAAGNAEPPARTGRRKVKRASHKRSRLADRRIQLMVALVALTVLILAAVPVALYFRSSGGKEVVGSGTTAGSPTTKTPPTAKSPPTTEPSKDTRKPATDWLPAWKLPPGAPPPAVAPFDAATARQHQQKWAEFLKVPVEQPNSLSMKLVLVPPGDFQMGYRSDYSSALRNEVEQKFPQALPLLDEYLAKLAPQHSARVGQPFVISACEVTIAQFGQFVQATGYRTTAQSTDLACTVPYFLPDPVNVSRRHVAWDGSHRSDTDPNEPVVFITPADALAFCDWLSTQEQAVYRLPTEDEWEFAYRAGMFLRYGFVDRAEDAAKFAWADEGLSAPPENRRTHPHPVGQKQANPFGLLDLAGNVAEFCDTGTAEGICSRGGVFKNPAIIDIYSRRDGAGIATPTPYHGFRVVREFPAPLETVPAAPLEAERWAINWLTKHGAQITQRAAAAADSTAPTAPDADAPSGKPDDKAAPPAFLAESVIIGAASDLRSADYAYLRHLGGLRSLCVSGLSFNDRAAAAVAALQTIEDLKLDNVGLSPAGWKHLGQLSNIRTLTVTPPVFSDAILAALAGWPNLAVLDLTQQPITDEGLKHLAGLRNLRQLVLTRTPVTDRGLEHLRELKSLAGLVLAETAVTDAGLANLAGLESLESLDLGTTAVTGLGLAALKDLPRLTKLNLASARVTDEGCAGIGQLIRLQALYLAQNNVSDAGLAQLRGLTDLNELTLMCTPITDAGLAALSELRHLRTLTMHQTPVSGVGLAHLRNLLSLESLDLMWTRTGDEALPVLAGFRRLTTLVLHGTRVRGEGLEQLAKLDALTSLQLSMTDVPAEKVEDLRRRMPNCQIAHDRTSSREFCAAHVATWSGGKAFATLQRDGALPDTVTGPSWVADYPAGLMHVVELCGEDCPFSNAVLNEAESVTELRYLNLRNARLTNDALGQVTGLKKLHTLILDQNRIDDLGLKHLEALDNLELLSLKGTRVTAAGVQSLLDKLPRCRLLADWPAPRRGGPLIADALVGQPAAVPGLRSWTLAWDGFRQQPTCVACSPQEDLLAAAGDGGWTSDRGLCASAIRVWALTDEPRPGFTGKSGSRQKVLVGHEGRIGALGWSPNGRYLASGGDDKTVRFWNVADGRCLRAFTLPGPATSLAWSPGGDRLIVVCEASLNVLEIAQGTFRPVAVAGVQAVDWAPDGTRFLTAVGQSVRVYDAATLTEERSLTTSELPLGTAAWSPDGKQIAAAYDGRLARIWDVDSCQLVKQLDGKAGEIAAVAWSPQGDRLATQGSVLAVWDVAQGSRVSVVGLTPSVVLTPRWTRTGTHVAVVSPASVDLYDAAKGTLQRSFGKLAPLGLAMAALSPDGRRLLTVQGTTGVLRDADTGQEISRWNDFNIAKGSLIWSPAGEWLAVVGPAQPGNLTLVDTSSGSLKQPPNTQAVTVRSFAWKADGSQFVIGDDLVARVCETTSGEVLKEFRHEVPVLHVAWSPDAKWLATMAGDLQIRIWNVASGQLERTAAALPAPYLPCLAWSPDSTELAAALQTGEVYRLEAATGKVTGLAFRLRGTDYPDTLSIATLAWSPDGHYLLASGYSEAAVWSRATGVLRRFERIGDQTVWLPDSQRLFRGTWEAFVKTGHDAATGKRLGTLLPQIGDDGWLLVGPEGHFQGSPKIEDNLLYVTLTDQGQQATYLPAEFGAKFQWQNDPGKARFLQLGPSHLAKRM